jgi:hypothetical protein
MLLATCGNFYFHHGIKCNSQRRDNFARFAIRNQVLIINKKKAVQNNIRNVELKFIFKILNKNNEKSKNLTSQLILITVSSDSICIFDVSTNM